jgi:creatinine amidohydrolase
VDAASRPHEYPGKLEDPGELRPELAPATFSWVTADISESGAIGAANEGTTEDGELWYQEGSAALARSIEEIFSDNES